MMVSRFREIVREDNDKVFMNLDEYSKEVLWNGKPLKVIEHANVEKQEYETQGINRNVKVLSVNEIDLDIIPLVAEDIDIDGEIWRIIDVRTPFARLDITLTRMT